MAIIDWVILAIYCAGILALALHFQARASRGLEEFFIADRSLPWWVICFADVAGYTGGGQAFVMVIFLSGYAGLWLIGWLSWVIWMPLVAILWAPMWRRLGVVTTGEFIEKRYAGRRATVYRSVYAVYACFAWGLTCLAYSVAWMAAGISPILGWTPVHIIVVFGALTIAYSLIAGLFAVAYNDILQFGILMAGNFAFGWLLVSKVGGVEQVWAKVELLRGHHFLSALPSGGSLTFVSLVALCVQGLFFAGSPFAGEGMTAQRFLAARNERHAVIGQISNGILSLVIRLIPFITIALAAVALYPPNSAPVPAALWGELVRRYAPSGLFGLLLVCSVAGSMATVSCVGNWAASYLVNDIYKRNLRPHAPQHELVLASRIISGLLLTAALTWGALIRLEQLDKWILFINSSLIVFSLPLAWLKWFWWRTNAVGDMVGILGSFPVGYVVWFGSDAVIPVGLRSWLHTVSGHSWNGLIPAFSNLQRYPFWVGFGLLFGLGWICIVGASFLTRPEPMDTLQRFYLTAKPIGWWGPVRHSLDSVQAGEARPEVRQELFACGFGVIFYFTLTLSLFNLMGGHFQRAMLPFAVAIPSGIAFAKIAISGLRLQLVSSSVKQQFFTERT